MVDLLSALAPYVCERLPAAARVAGMVAAAPVFSSAQVPPLPRALLVVALAAALAPLAPPTPVGGLSATGYLGLVLGELALGLLIGLGAQLLLQALSFAGQVLDLQMGLYSSALYDPAAGGQTTLLGRAYYLVGTVVFLELGGHHWLLRGLVDTFGRVQFGDLRVGPDWWLLTAGLGESIFHLALMTVAPIMLTLFLVDLAFGMVARAAPQMNIFIVEMPGKILVGFIAVLVCAPLLLGMVGALIGDLNGLVRALILMAQR